MALAKNLRLGDKYRIIRKIGSGSFGVIYLGWFHFRHDRAIDGDIDQQPYHNKGTDVTTGEEVAIKAESDGAEYPQLEIEAEIFKLLYGGVGIPRVHYYGTENNHRVMVVDLLGRESLSLNKLC